MYVPLDVNFPDDEAVERCSMAAIGTYCVALCIAKRLLTDGAVTRRALMRHGADEADMDELVSVGLMDDDGQTLTITGWLAHNLSAEVVMSPDRGKRMAHIRHHERKGIVKDGCQWCEETNPQVVTGIMPRQMPELASGNARHLPETEVETETETESEVETEGISLVSGDHPVAGSVAEVLDHVADLMADANMAAGKITHRASWRKVTRASLDSNAELVTKVRHGLATYDEPPKTIAQWSQGIRDARWMTRRSVVAS